MSGDPYDDISAPAPPQQAPVQQPVAAFTDTGQGGTPQQQAFYQALNASSPGYATSGAAPGSQGNPVGLRPGDDAPTDQYYVDLDGQLHPPGTPSTAATPGAAAPAAPLSAPLPTGAIAADPYGDIATAAGPPKPVDEGLGFAEGVTKPLDNMATWLDHGPLKAIDEGIANTFGIPSTADAIAQRKAAFNAAGQTRTPGAIGSVAGNIVGTLPAMMLPGGLLAQGAAAGALSSDNPNDPMAVAKDAALGAGGAYLGGKVIGGIIGRAASPRVGSAAQLLLDNGVRLTPGQITGGAGKTLEDTLTSVPILRDSINAARTRGLEDFNRAALNRTLDPIGEQVPASVNVGRDGVGYAQDRLGAAYDAIAPQLSAPVDLPFINGVGAIRSNIAPQALDHLPEFDRVLQEEVMSRVGPSGALDGQSAKDAQTAIGQSIRQYSSSDNPKTQALVRGLTGLQGELQSSLDRGSPPEAATALRNINKGFASFVRVQRAATNAGEKDAGLFTPNQLSRAVKASDGTIRKGAFARGSALMQDLSSAGEQVLPSTVPDSGTALRYLTSEIPMLVGFGAESGHFFPQLAGSIGLLGTAGAPYTRLGQSVVQKALTSRPWTAAQSQIALAPVRKALANSGAVSAAGGLGPLLQLPSH